ncbi:hypothetical protein MMC08_008650 [Hypocenomyce scalaris]|nr:hypothetical protein [Hypocenomyce scalaris]
MSKEIVTHTELASPQYATPFVEDPALERRILRKVDIRLIPPLFIMYILNCLPGKDLDRNNIGNAKEAGMDVALNLSSSDYSLAVSIFFIGYLLLEVPSNMILSRTRPSLYLPGIMLVWGCLATAYTGVNTKGGLYALRFCLGLIEAGYFPGVLLFMSSWYKKDELARRFSIFYCASLVSGAVGGLIAGLIVDHMQNRGDLPAWKWLFLIEGVITIGCAFIAVLILPDFPATTKWLTDEEREYAIRRLQHNNTASRAGDITHLQSLSYALKDWRTWLFMIAQSLCTCAGTITYFIPTLLASLGYAGQDVQYMTIPIYMVALVIVLICCFSSDLQNERPKHIMVMASISTVSLIIVAAINNSKARYAFLTFGAAGICALANLSSVYGSYIWPSSSAPQFIPGFSVSTALMFGCVITALLLMIFTKKYPYELTKDGGYEERVQLSEVGSVGEV